MLIATDFARRSCAPPAAVSAAPLPPAPEAEGGEPMRAWLQGPTLEDRLLALFTIAGRKLSSDEAMAIWVKLLPLVIERVEPDLADQLVRQAIMLAPEYAPAQQLYAALMGSRTPPQPRPDLVFLITSCERYLKKALRLQADLAARGAHARIVVGDPSLRAAVEDAQCVRLPVSDSYEALPHKVLEGLTWVRQTYGPVPVAKIDDDIQLAPEFLPRALAIAAEEMQYVGERWGGMCDRAWHLGKTSVPTPIYGRRMRGFFAYGPLYLLGTRAVEHLVRQWVFFPGDLAGRIYEDRAIGELLADGDIALQHVPIAQMGGIVSNDERFVKRPY